MRLRQPGLSVALVAAILSAIAARASCAQAPLTEPGDILIEDSLFGTVGSSQRLVVCLGGKEMVGKAPSRPSQIRRRPIPYPFFDEIFRQAVLIAARDELGVATRDSWLGETCVDGRGVHLELEWNDTSTGPSGTTEMRVVFVDQTGGTEKEEFRLILDMGNPLDAVNLPQWSRYSMLTVLEKASREDLPEILTEKLGLRAQRNKWFAKGRVPEEIHDLLGEPTFTSQYLAVRKLHTLIREDGESPRRLAALVWGYVHLGYLSECYFHPMHEVFKVRALLYAARLEVRQQEANEEAGYAQGIVPVTHALTGFRGYIGDRQDELPDLAETVEPSWILLGQPCHTFDLDNLVELAKRPELKTWAPLFYLSHLSYTGNEPETLKLQRVFVKQYPECYRIWLTPSYYWGVNEPMQARREHETLLGSTLYHRLNCIDDLPGLVRRVVHDGLQYAGNSWTSSEHQTRARLIESLTAAADEANHAGKPNEMSWQVLASLIRELTFSQAITRANFLRDCGASASTKDLLVDTTEPALRNHRYWDLLAAYHSGSKGEDAEKRLVADPDSLFDRFYRLTDFDFPLWCGVDDDRLDIFWRPISDRLSRSNYLMPHVRNKFYTNVRRALRRPLTDENNKTGVVDRISVSPSNPWLVQYRIEHEWGSISPDKVNDWWNKYEAFPEVRRSIALRYARSGQNAEAIKRISAVLDSADEPDCDLFLALGDAHMAEGNVDGFVDSYRQFIEHPGRHKIGDIAWAGYLGGLTVLGTERHDSAEFFLERSAETPTDQGRLALAILRELQGRTEEADEILWKRVADRPNAALDYYWFCLRVQRDRLDEASAMVREAFRPLQPVLRDNRFGSTGTTYDLWASITGDVERSELVGRLTRRHADPFQRLHGMLLEMEGQRESNPLLPPRFAPCPTRFLTGSRPCLEIVLREFSEASMDNTSISEDEIERIVEDAPFWETANVLYFVAKYLALRGEEERAVQYWRRTVKLPMIRKTNRNLAVYELRKRGMADEEYRELIRIGR